MKKKFNCLVQYLRNNYFSYWAVLALDTFIALCSTIVAYTGIHYITETFFQVPMLFRVFLVSIAASLLGSYVFHTYRNTIRFSQLRELWRLACSSLVKTAVMAVRSEEHTSELQSRQYLVCRL